MVSSVKLHVGSNPINRQILELCPLLKSWYWASPIVFNSHLQGIILMRLRKKLDPCYRREIILAADGATLELDWGESEGPELTPESPIVFILSGITGNSSSSYIVYLMIAFRKLGWRPVMMNYPNATGSPLTAPRFFCLDSVSDTTTVIELLEKRYPNAPKVGIGFSLGGHFFTKYAQAVGSKSPLLGIMTLSAPFSALICSDYWKGKWIHENVYDRHFLQKFKGGYERNLEIFAQNKKIVSEEVLKAANMYDLHSTLSTKLYGVDSVEEYLDIMSSDKEFPKIQMPMLILHAWNDPVIPPNSIPTKLITDNPNIIFATTKTGGHTGWVSGLKPFTSLAWCEKLVLQYAQALVKMAEKSK